MRFRFCGDADCPDWVLVEINTLSKLSSIKLKLLAQVVAQGIINPPLQMDKAEKLFSESKLDADIDLKACIACITYILTSTTRFNCDSNALQNELQQLGLPREHSTSLKRVVDDQIGALTDKFRAASLKVNPLEDIVATVDADLKCAILDLKINGENRSVALTPFTVNVLLENLEEVRKTMVELKEAS
ncbi:COMM domain-containing protein 4 [Diabrotica virgifera virgifera]|uniref:COMM domain-containing protein 4 n=1 Tax=Diabrotica virgifera virgifera TaxID=50390 RepID=A0A6P7GM65_DIAVI|nr:COMM domain-containing protein 4 [Diabrotica virgifera virgifera]XP_028144870.1 COMM domain-containing protein 4 [Diabrotica virgifera virgifera]XP_028144876.1 COMM domain-containing protein 4 [Diabrotica virgifera virgifera]